MPRVWQPTDFRSGIWDTSLSTCVVADDEDTGRHMLRELQQQIDQPEQRPLIIPEQEKDTFHGL